MSSHPSPFIVAVIAMLVMPPNAELYVSAAVYEPARGRGMHAQSPLPSGSAPHPLFWHAVPVRQAVPDPIPHGWQIPFASG